MLETPTFLYPRARFAASQGSVRILIAAQQINLLKHHNVGGLERDLLGLVSLFRLKPYSRE